MAKADKVLFEVDDNYQKQTYRTRCYIYSPNGKQLLNIPIKNANSTQKTKDALIDYSFGWQKQHLKSFAAAYRSSPYYEYYEDEFNTLFDDKPKFLLDYNLLCQEKVIEFLGLELNVTKTVEYHKIYNSELDLRYLANAKLKQSFKFAEYTQGFSDKHGFIPNLSILDLLFMEGTNALTYLESQKIEF